MPQINQTPPLHLPHGLPQITAAGITVPVTCYVAGCTAAFAAPGEKALSPGCADGASDLWMLSLVGDMSEATSLEAAWSYLANKNQTAALLEDPTRSRGRAVTVALGRHRRDLASLGWRPHFRWLTCPISGTESLHGVLEPLELTTCGGGQNRGQGAPHGGLADPAAVKKHVEEMEARRLQPLFILLARPADAPELGQRSRTLAQYHLRFLASRCAWMAYHSPHQHYLWERAWAEGEVEPLYTYCYAASGQLPRLAGAFLCRPKLLELDAALRSAIVRGVFGQPV
jgi:hypothetical protein